MSIAESQNAITLLKLQGWENMGYLIGQKSSRALSVAMRQAMKVIEENPSLQELGNHNPNLIQHYDKQYSILFWIPVDTCRRMAKRSGRISVLIAIPHTSNWDCFMPRAAFF